MTGDTPHSAGAPIPLQSTADAAVKTYDYLRLAVVGLPLLLGVSVAIEWTTGQRGLGSISAYYYTPVRSVFVGALVGMGLALIALKGRDRNHEDVLLNVAGMLAPVVAFVPTPLHQGQLVDGGPVRCPGDAVRCVPEAYVAGIDNNSYALAAVGLLGIAAAYLTARRERPLDGSKAIDPRSRRGLLVSVLVVAAFLTVFLAAHEAFLLAAHYASAVPMFGLLVVVVAINARESRRMAAMFNRTFPYGRFYRVIWIAMATALVSAGGYLVVLWASGIPAWEGWVFLLEAVLLALFTAFWVLQTHEFYRRGVPADA